MHLAQINIAEWKVDPDGAEAKPFMDALASVNAVAERSPGFVWRLVGEGGEDATTLRPFGERDIIVNMTVWETPEHLEHFVWNTVHKAIYRRKNEWFAQMRMSGFVMWWVEPGHEPTMAEAKERLDHLNEHGHTDHAFGWAHLPQVQQWREQRCA